MIKADKLLSIDDFESLEKGDLVACEFHRDVIYKNKRVKFGVFEVALNKRESFEIVLDRKSNTYFNYRMFLGGESNLKSIILLTSDNGN